MNEPSPVAAEPSPSPELPIALEGTPSLPSNAPEAAAVLPLETAPAPVPSLEIAGGRAVAATDAEPVAPDAGTVAPSVPAPSVPVRTDRSDGAVDMPGTPAPAVPDTGGTPDNVATGPAVAPAAETVAEPSGDPALATDPAAPPAPAPEATAEAEPPKIGVDVRFIDFAGQPIADLQHKVAWTEKGRRIEFPGTTDARGQGVRIFSMAMNTRFELWVRKDDGSYVVKHRGTVSCENLSLCVVSPHIRIKVATEIHAGSPGTLPPKPAAQDARVERRPNAPVGRTADGAPPEAKLQPGRDAHGHPVATSTVPSRDANDRHRLPTFALWAWKSFIERFRDFTMPAKVPAAAAAAVPAVPASVSPGPTNRGAVPAKPPEAPPRKREPAAVPVLAKAQTVSPQARTASKADLERVQKLIECMEEQARWDWAELKRTYGTSASIKNALANGTFNFSVAQKDEKHFTGNCYMSVKVGLWRAGYVEGVSGGISPSTDAKAWLESQGYKDVANSLPDARWAEPGDVIVYEYDETTIKKNNEKIKGALEIYEKEQKEYPEKKNLYEKEYAEWKGRQSVGLSMLKEGKKGKKDSKDPEPKPPKLPQKPQGENYGHIDVRTYDGYISDAKVTKLPVPILRPINRKGMVVNGIFRKLSDPMAQIKVKAFLKCIREWECHEEQDDQKRYYLMYSAVNGSRRFSETSRHPHESSGEENSTAAGAYQTNLSTYRRLSLPEYGVGQGFSPIIQDQLAVAYLEILPLNPLALIRLGRISEAADAIKRIWSSMPSGEHPRREVRGKSSYVFSMSDLLQRHEAIVREMISE